MASLINYIAPLPASLGAPRRKPASFLDDVHALMRDLYEGDYQNSAKFRLLIDGASGGTTETGHPKFDEGFAAKMIQDHAVEKGMYPEVAKAKLVAIARKIQWSLRRHDTPELAFSRSARVQLAARQAAAAYIASTTEDTVGNTVVEDTTVENGMTEDTVGNSA